MAETRAGGSFAPRVDGARVAAYRGLLPQAAGPVRDAMTSLLRMVEVFNETPDAEGEGELHPSGRGRAVALSRREVERIDSVVPWGHEIEAYAQLFDAIDARTQKPLRDAAFHLLWYARELFLDRQPMTTDLLGPPAQAKAAPKAAPNSRRRR
jgi:hypothetical protein